jgi:cytochrome P450
MSDTALSEDDDQTTAQRPPRRIKDLPSPPGLPLLGHLTRLEATRAHTQMEQWARELGTPYRLNMAGMPIVVWSDVNSHNRALRERPHLWRRSSRIQPVSIDMGLEGVFSTEGASWTSQRKLVMQALNPTHMRGFYPTLHAITERLHKRWSRAADEGRVVEMADDLMRYTVDVTSALAFGEDPNTLERDGDRIQQHLAGILPMFMKRILMPVSYWHWFKLPADRKLDQDLAVVHAYVRDLIERTRQRMRDEPSDMPRNLLESFLQQRDEPGSGITDEVVSANVLTMLIAGEDTTANSIAWTLLLLAQEPGWQDRLHEEAVARLGQHAVCPDIEALRQLDLCEATVNEGQRMKPVVPIQSVEPTQDVTHDGVALPKGTAVYFINRPSLDSAEHFHEPTRFDPERWLRARDAQPGPHNQRAFLQFGAGPRVCPGRHLAGVEMRLVMSMLMREFRIELACKPEEVQEVLAFTCTPSKMPIRLIRR